MNTSDSRLPGPRREVWAFAPRSRSAEPTMFGKTSGHLPPKEGVDRQDPNYKAADLQHLVADAVRRGMKTTLRRYIENDGGYMSELRYDRLIRMQRGEVQMQLPDILIWSSRFPEVASIVAQYFDGLSVSVLNSSEH